ncbi:MAG: HNH endonuclease [candidate division Zixibacteria bacterium]|jgi:hypothetical protein|nr:HNH endonuclease [candidate division Zixibacteria bacterium]
MKDDILTYRQMCDSEQVQTLQRGMNFRLNPAYSVILMSQRNNAPYRDEILPDGITIIYEGHDTPKTPDEPSPKSVDQPQFTKNGGLTQNGRFVEAVQRFRSGEPAEIVKVYEKVLSGVWSFKGLFELIDYQFVSDGIRNVFKFRLVLCDRVPENRERDLPVRSRIIPSNVKMEVWKRDGGKCVICGATDELHFDHEIPFSKGGTSITAANVRILCARHNLKKSSRIE